jgi:large subunit ribosomal protein L23
MKDLHDVIIKPVLSEKSYDLIADKKYTFLVNVHSNRTEIKQAVEQVFGVQVDKVTTARRIGKMKRQGRTQGRRPETKRAFVTLKEGSKSIEFFESMQ